MSTNERKRGAVRPSRRALSRLIKSRAINSYDLQLALSRMNKRQGA